MKKYGIPLFLILLGIVNFSAAHICSGCDATLIQEVKDKYKSTANINFEEVINKLFSHDYAYWSHYDKSSGKGVLSDAGSEIFSGSFPSGTKDSEREFDAMKRNYRKNYILSETERVFIAQKCASPEAYARWADCMYQCAARKGLNLHLEEIGNDETMLSVVWIPTATTKLDATAPISDIQCVNCSIDTSALLKKGKKLQPFIIVLGKIKKLNRNKDASIYVTAKGLDPASILIPNFEDAKKENKTQQVSSPVNVAVITAAKDTTAMKDTPPPAAMPVGSVVVFAGWTVPQGWLLCDGRELDAHANPEYKTLSEVIGIAWGKGNGETMHFNIPDLRGMFLRGVDVGGNNDPDHDLRTRLHSAEIVGDVLGSYQGDGLKEHSHETEQVEVQKAVDADEGDKGYLVQAAPAKKSGKTFGGKETRPKNVYVYYMIKY